MGRGRSFLKKDGSFLVHVVYTFFLAFEIVNNQFSSGGTHFSIKHHLIAICLFDRMGDTNWFIKDLVALKKCSEYFGKL